MMFWNISNSSIKIATPKNVITKKTVIFVQNVHTRLLKVEKSFRVYTRKHMIVIPWNSSVRIKCEILKIFLMDIFFFETFKISNF